MRKGTTNFTTSPTVAGASTISDTAWTGANWSDTTIAPSKHATEHALLTRGELTLVERKTFDAPATSYTLSGLNGDVDRRYKIVSMVKNVYAGAASFKWSCNTDTGNNYSIIRFYHYKATGDGTPTESFDRSSGPGVPGLDAAAQNMMTTSEVEIFAPSGIVRLMKFSGCTQLNASEIFQQFYGHTMWTNTADNITQLVLTASQANAIGIGSYIELWKLAQ